MKPGIFRSITTVSLIFLLFTANFSAAYAASGNKPSSWASQKINICAKAGIIPEDFDSQPFTRSITRRDFCELLINTCRIFKIALPEPPASHPFTDTTDIAAEYSYMLGLTRGTSTGIFSPETPLTREMAAVMLSRMLKLFQSASGSEDEQPMSSEKADQILREYSTDYNLVSEWAKTHMAEVYSLGILSGTGGGRLEPKGELTREQAAVLSLNVLAYCDESQIRDAGVEVCVLPKPTGIYISPSYKAGDVLLRWNDIPSASAYDITISKNGVPTYTGRINTNYLDLRIDLSNHGKASRSSSRKDGVDSLYNAIFGNDNKLIHAAIKVTPVNNSGEPSVFFLQQEFSITPGLSVNEIITGDPARNQFADINEANRNMTDITVRVWKLTASGSKETSSLTLTVNKNVAEDVKKIFEEIYNGKEKFPIKNCSGYDYRDGKSQHSNGTAIDINWEENYFISNEGEILAGKLWKPGVNPYSIPPDGDVVRAFNRYGWHWSPDMNWRNGKDYMHFSLNGK